MSLRVSITRYSAFCDAEVEEALARHRTPAIFGMDQDAQFTIAAFTGLLHDCSIQINIDDKVCEQDNIFVERLCRSLRYKEVFLHDYASV